MGRVTLAMLKAQIAAFEGDLARERARRRELVALLSAARGGLFYQARGRGRRWRAVLAAVDAALADEARLQEERCGHREDVA